MKWRTDKPTANVIVALVRFDDENMIGHQITEYRFRALERFADDFYVDYYADAEHIPIDRIVKWADLEEDEVVDLPMWKKSNLPNADKCEVGINSDNLCYNGYYISYKELFQKLPKEDERR